VSLQQQRQPLSCSISGRDAMLESQQARQAAWALHALYSTCAVLPEVVQTTEKPWVLVQRAETITPTADILQQGTRQQLLSKEVRCAAISICM
jgi:hypothetical protein